MSSKYSTRPARDHSGQTYGAIVVGDMDKNCSTSRGFRYDISWMCCGKVEKMSQKDLNVRRGNMPGQCQACRLAGKKPLRMAESRGTSDRAKADIIWVDSPWGRVQSLFGWSPEARINRPWSFE